MLTFSGIRDAMSLGIFAFFRFLPFFLLLSRYPNLLFPFIPLGCRPFPSFRKDKPQKFSILGHFTLLPIVLRAVWHPWKVEQREGHSRLLQRCLPNKSTIRFILCLTLKLNHPTQFHVSQHQSQHDTKMPYTYSTSSFPAFIAQSNVLSQSFGLKAKNRAFR